MTAWVNGGVLRIVGKPRVAPSKLLSEHGSNANKDLFRDRLGIAVSDDRIPTVPPIRAETREKLKVCTE